METFVIVEFAQDASNGAEPYISRIIRTYLSRSRAGEDLDLLRESAPDRRFDIIEVQHIDN